MGTVTQQFQWDMIGPGATVGVFLHSFNIDEYAGFNINVALASDEPEGAYESIAAQLTDGATTVFFGAFARTLWVQNQTVGPQPYISATLVMFDQQG
ncbi:hypothetical protein [Paraburkholderia unamae]|uniref:Uncharacterized protein n=1 Tax=Paraburkholderia unamae TaxID=219649 RepID=A0ACC6RXA1_9BURK